MLKGYIQADYSPENWKILLDIKAAADAEIDNAASVADVMTALNNAGAAMAAVHTLLGDAKAAAHASLNAAFAGYAQGDYSPENWTILLNAMAIGDTENAASVADVVMAVSNAEAAMAAVHTLLTDAKIAAHISLETAHAAYTQGDYSPDDWTALNGIWTAGDAAIDEATDLAGVEAAQSAAAAGMDGVQTIAQTLAAAKSAAHDALAAALETYSESEYTGDDWAVLHGFMTAADTAIDEATDLAGVEAAQSAATVGMDGVQTIAQTLAAAKSAAHNALAAELETYSESEYTGDDWTELVGIKTAGDTAIDEATDLIGVESVQSAAAAGMNGVQTIAQTLAAAKSAAHNALAEALGINENDTADDEVAVTEPEVSGEIAVDTVTDIDHVEEQAMVDLPTSETGTEFVEVDTENGVVTASQEASATSDITPDTAEEKAADVQPALESITPDIEPAQ